jgi:hypothetical protein
MLLEPLKNQGLQKSVQPREGTEDHCAHRSKRVHNQGTAYEKKRKLVELKNLQYS